MDFTPLAIKVEVHGEGFTVDGVLFPTFDIFQYYIRLLRAEHRREIWGRALVAVFQIDPLPKDRITAMVLDMQRDDKVTEWLEGSKGTTNPQNDLDEATAQPVKVIYAAARKVVAHHVNRFGRPDPSRQLSLDHMTIVREIDREVQITTPGIRRNPIFSKERFNGPYYLTVNQLPEERYIRIRDVDELKECCRFDISRSNDVLACERTCSRTGLGVFKLVSRRQLQVEHCDAILALPQRFINTWNKENDAAFPITVPSVGKLN